MATSRPKRTTFLELPGELRNRIYYFYFCAGNELALAAPTTQLHPKPVKTIKLCVTSTLGRVYRTHDEGNSLGDNKSKDKYQTRPLIQSRIMGRYLRVHGASTNWATSLNAVSLVNKQMYAETLPLLYAATHFISASPKRVLNFLTYITPNAAAWIRTLELTYTTYGNPPPLHLAHLRRKHIDSWTAMCRLTGKLLLGLEDLRVWIHVTAAPLHMDLRQDWVAPLLQFRRLTVGKSPSPSVSPCPSPKLIKVVTTGEAPHKTRLINIDVKLSSTYTQPFRWAHPAPEVACFELHRLFGEAITKAILGLNEKDAMEEWEEAWNETYADWRHFLKFRALY